MVHRQQLDSVSRVRPDIGTGKEAQSRHGVTEQETAKAATDRAA